jgi:hypothetical protein
MRDPTFWYIPKWHYEKLFWKEMNEYLRILSKFKGAKK